MQGRSPAFPRRQRRRACSPAFPPLPHRGDRPTGAVCLYSKAAQADHKCFSAVRDRRRQKGSAAGCPAAGSQQGSCPPGPDRGFPAASAGCAPRHPSAAVRQRRHRKCSPGHRNGAAAPDGSDSAGPSAPTATPSISAYPTPPCSVVSGSFPQQHRGCRRRVQRFAMLAHRDPDRPITEGQHASPRPSLPMAMAQRR